MKAERKRRVEDTYGKQMSCATCAFQWRRPPSENASRGCPKCQTPIGYTHGFVLARPATRKTTYELVQEGLKSREQKIREQRNEYVPNVWTEKINDIRVLMRPTKTAKDFIRRPPSMPYAGGMFYQTRDKKKKKKSDALDAFHAGIHRSGGAASEGVPDLGRQGESGDLREGNPFEAEAAPSAASQNMQPSSTTAPSYATTGFTPRMQQDLRGDALKTLILKNKGARKHMPRAYLAAYLEKYPDSSGSHDDGRVRNALKGDFTHPTE
jgi:hypothetical protein